jgi:hypothetical protein
MPAPAAPLSSPAMTVRAVVRLALDEAEEGVELDGDEPWLATENPQALG